MECNAEVFHGTERDWRHGPVLVPRQCWLTVWRGSKEGESSDQLGTGWWQEANTGSSDTKCLLHLRNPKQWRPDRTGSGNPRARQLALPSQFRLCFVHGVDSALPWQRLAALDQKPVLCFVCLFKWHWYDQRYVVTLKAPNMGGPGLASGSGFLSDLGQL